MQIFESVNPYLLFIYKFCCNSCYSSPDIQSHTTKCQVVGAMYNRAGLLTNCFLQRMVIHSSITICCKKSEANEVMDGSLPLIPCPYLPGHVMGKVFAAATGSFCSFKVMSTIGFCHFNIIPLLPLFFFCYPFKWNNRDMPFLSSVILCCSNVASAVSYLQRIVLLLMNHSQTDHYNLTDFN